MNNRRRLRPRSKSNPSHAAAAVARSLDADPQVVKSGAACVQLPVTADQWLRLQEESPDGFVLLRPVRDSAAQVVDFEFVYANPAAQKMLADNSGHLRGRRLFEVVAEIRVSVERLVQVVETGAGQVVEQPIEREGRKRHWRMVAVRFSDGIAVTLGDLNSTTGTANLAGAADGEVDAAWQRVREKEEALARLNIVVGAAPVGIALLDHDLRYLMINQLLADINGLTIEENRGRCVSDVIPHLAPQFETISRGVLASG